MQIDEQVQGTLTPVAPPPMHLAVLDGWRGLSIALVLATHLLPLGPKAWMFNHGAGMLGMVLFFNLSGFLITSFLLKEQNIPSFLIRRFFRVIPLAWLYLLAAMLISGATAPVWAAHFLFYANLPPKALIGLTDHIWSLCLEIQFYVGVAVLVGLLRVRGLLLLPVLGLLFTALRIWDGVYASSISYYRIDEILAGCTLALAYHGRLGAWLPRLMARVPAWLLLPLLLLSCLPQGLWMNYLRPYLAALLIGTTIVQAGTALGARLNGRLLVYLAGISYSLYVIHPMLAASWLGSGDVLVKYAKRPMLFLVLFALSYLSTHYYERWFMDSGRKLAARFGGARRPAPDQAAAATAARDGSGRQD